MPRCDLAPSKTRHQPADSADDDEKNSLFFSTRQRLSDRAQLTSPCTSLTTTRLTASIANQARWPRDPPRSATRRARRLLRRSSFFGSRSATSDATSKTWLASGLNTMRDVRVHPAWPLHHRIPQARRIFFVCCAALLLLCLHSAICDQAHSEPPMATSALSPIPKFATETPRHLNQGRRARLHLRSTTPQLRAHSARLHIGECSRPIQPRPVSRKAHCENTNIQSSYLSFGSIELPVPRSIRCGGV